jgi:hypothetical protein
MARLQYRARSLSRRLLLLLLAWAEKSHAYYSGDGHPEEHRVAEAGEVCRARLGHAVGSEWMKCTIGELVRLQERAQAAGVSDYFPVVPHLMEPLRADPAARKERGHAEGARTSELLKNLLRNYSCDVADGGSQPVRSMTWEYQPPDPCGDSSDDPNAPLPAAFSYKPGFLPAGNDLPELGSLFTEAEAEKVCLASKQCAGFTYHAPSRGRAGARHTIHFKSIAEGSSDDGSGNWHTMKRRSQGLVCSGAMRRPPPPRLRLRVDVLRESPPVDIVPDFATERECEHMMNQTLPRMERSVVFGGSAGGSASNYRQSYSVNMYPDYDDELNVITRMVRRKFAFAREVADYEQLIEGEGQEPLNSVYYKDWDDQYRPHCDGQCYGGRYRKGERIATSLTYCTVADKGGYTYFSRSGLKVVPKPRQMLFFGYKLPPAHEGGEPRMDDGHTEHSGCPLREGRKWIATMWYREGMTAEKGWESYRTGG